MNFMFALIIVDLFYHSHNSTTNPAYSERSAWSLLRF